MEIIKKIIQMNNIVNKGIKTLILLLLACLIASCNSMDHDLEFNQLNDEIAHLKNVDDSISKEITNELLKLETELKAEITEVEDFISDKLAKKIIEIDTKIKGQANSLNNVITDHSNQIGLQITNWDNEIGQLIITRSEALETARGVMQRANEKAIAENNTALQSRIQQGEQHLNSFENILPNLAQSTSKRIDVVITMQARYNTLTDSLTSLETQRDLLESQIAGFKSKMETAIYDRLQEHATSNELNDLFEQVSDIYYEAVDIVQEMESINNDLDAIESNLPDVDSWLSDLEQYFNEIDGILDFLSEFEGQDLESILDKCEDVENLADEMSGRLENAADKVLERANVINDLLVDMLGSISDLLGELEGYVNDLNDIISDVDALISEF